MALYVDSAFLDDITTTAASLPLAGVTTNPTILRAARERGQKLDHLEILMALLSRVPGTIFMQPGSPDEEEMYQQARTYIQAAPGRVIPKIPMTSMGMRVAHRLKQQGYRVSFTAVTTVAQAYSAALAGADFVIPYYGRLENSGIDASKRISEIATVLSRAELPTRILAASIKSPQDAASALLAGAHDLTITPQVLRDMLSDPLSEEAVARFNQDWQALNKL
jgi:TalC/MipB family fructose-6-phosphate aldolase